MAKIYYDIKETATNNAKAKYQDEITGAAAATETPTETTGEPVQVSRVNPSVGYADSSFATAYEQSSMPTTLKRGSPDRGASRGGRRFIGRYVTREIYGAGRFEFKPLSRLRRQLPSRGALQAAVTQ